MNILPKATVFHYADLQTTVSFFLFLWPQSSWYVSVIYKACWRTAGLIIKYRPQQWKEWHFIFNNFICDHIQCSSSKTTPDYSQNILPNLLSQNLVISYVTVMCPLTQSLTTLCIVEVSTYILQIEVEFNALIYLQDKYCTDVWLWPFHPTLSS